LRGYKLYTPSDELLYRPDWVEHNYNLFLKHHTLSADDLVKNQATEN
jgi:hypothetical protein